MGIVSFFKKLQEYISYKRAEMEILEAVDYVFRQPIIDDKDVVKYLSVRMGFDINILRRCNRLKLNKRHISLGKPTMLDEDKFKQYVKFVSENFDIVTDKGNEIEAYDATGDKLEIKYVLFDKYKGTNVIYVLQQTLYLNRQSR